MLHCLLFMRGLSIIQFVPHSYSRNCHGLHFCVLHRANGDGAGHLRLGVPRALLEGVAAADGQLRPVAVEGEAHHAGRVTTRERRASFTLHEVRQALLRHGVPHAHRAVRPARREGAVSTPQPP